MRQESSRPRFVRRIGRCIVCVGVAASLLVVAAPTVDADWLLLTDGTMVETGGAWKVKGNMVVFSMPNGGLASLRLSKVDLGASADLSLQEREKQLAPPEVKEPVEPKAAYIITDDTVSHGENDPSTADSEATPPGEEAAEGGLVVTAWDQRDATADGGLIVTGTLRNQGSNTNAGISVFATLYDADGVVIATETAKLNARALAPQQRTSFRVDFVDVFSFAAVNFDIDSQSFATPSDDREAREDEPAPEDGSDNNDIRRPTGLIAPATT